MEGELNVTQQRVVNVLLPDILVEQWSSISLHQPAETVKLEPAVVHLEDEVPVNQQPKKEKELTFLQLEMRREIYRSRRMAHKVRARVVAESSVIKPTKVTPNAVRFVGLRDSGICLGSEPEDGFSVDIPENPVQFVPLPYRALPSTARDQTTEFQFSDEMRFSSPTKETEIPILDDDGGSNALRPLEETHSGHSNSDNSGVVRKIKSRARSKPKRQAKNQTSKPEASARSKTRKPTITAPLTRAEALQAAQNIWKDPHPARPDQPGLARRNSVGDRVG